ncbi:MAG: hypothetical protein GY754_01120 [bacterium]|nr:hypothetical protein [bacterium]
MTSDIDAGQINPYIANKENELLRSKLTGYHNSENNLNEAKLPGIKSQKINSKDGIYVL